MSTRTIAAIVILIGILIAVTYDKKQVMAPVPSDEGVVCTQEAKQCPDGSYVGRSGPQCQFADCPSVVVPPTSSVQTGTLQGVVTTAPTCGGPERIPPSDGCEPRALQTKVMVSGAGKIYTATSDREGKYSLVLPVGTYQVQAQGGDPFPQCLANTVVIRAKQTLTHPISCDTGIR